MNLKILNLAENLTKLKYACKGFWRGGARD